MIRLIFTFSVPVATERDRTKTQTAREREREQDSERDFRTICSDASSPHIVTLATGAQCSSGGLKLSCYNCDNLFS